MRHPYTPLEVVFVIREAAYFSTRENAQKTIDGLSDLFRYNVFDFNGGFYIEVHKVTGGYIGYLKSPLASSMSSVKLFKSAKVEFAPPSGFKFAGTMQ